MNRIILDIFSEVSIREIPFAEPDTYQYEIDLSHLFTVLSLPVYMIYFGKQYLTDRVNQRSYEKIKRNIITQLPKHDKRSDLVIILCDLNENTDKYNTLRTELYNRNLIPLFSVPKLSEYKGSINDYLKTSLLSSDYTSILRYRLQPYKVSEPAEYGMFYGRTNELKKVTNSQESFYIVGARRIGKSSLVKKLQSNMGSMIKRISISPSDIINKCSYVDLNDTKPDPLNLALDIIEGFGTYAERIPTNREMTAKETVRAINPMISLKYLIKTSHEKLIIILDEIDNYLKLDENQGWTCASYLRELRDSKNVRLILVGYEKLDSYMTSDDFPLFGGRLKRFFLKGLEKEDINSLVLNPLNELGFKFANKPIALRYIWDTCFGRANLVQDICEELIINAVESEEYNSIREKSNSDYLLSEQELKDAIESSSEFLIFKRAIHQWNNPLAKIIFGISSLIRDNNDNDIIFINSESELENPSYKNLNSISYSDLTNRIEKYIEFSSNDYNQAIHFLNIRYYITVNAKDESRWRINSIILRDYMAKLVLRENSIDKWVKKVLIENKIV